MKVGKCGFCRNENVPLRACNADTICENCTVNIVGAEWDEGLDMCEVEKVAPYGSPVVYILRSITLKGIYKIGHTHALALRLRTLPSTNTLRITHLIRTDTREQSVTVENGLHVLFARKRQSITGKNGERCNGGTEWFRLSLEDIEQIKHLTVEEMIGISRKANAEKTVARILAECNGFQSVAFANALKTKLTKDELSELAILLNS